jgi:putative ABC transport system permease protein
MSSRWKKVWADFWGNKTRTFLTIITIIAGTSAVGFSINMRLYMNESMDTDFLSANPSEATVSAYPLDEVSVKNASEVPGVEAVEGRSVISAQVIHTDGSPIAIVFNALEDPAAQKLDLLLPVKGETSLPPLGDKQILVDSSVASLGYEPGDPVTIKFSNGKFRTVTVAGFVHDITGIPYGPWGQTIFAFVTEDTMEWLGGTRTYNTLLVSVAENQTDQAHVTKVAQAVANRMEEGGATVHYISAIQPGHHFSWNQDQGIFFLLGFLGYMTVFLSAFLIINTITALMAQQTRQIGIMKSFGGGTTQIFGMYIILILAFGLVALIISIPMGGGIAQFIGTGMSETLGFYTIPFEIYPQAIVQQVFVAIIVPLLAVIWPVYSSVRISIREALTSYGIGTKAKPNDKNISKGTLLIPRPMRLSLRNAFRRKARLSLTLFALVLGGSIFIGVFSTRAAFEKLIEDVQGYFLSDVNIAFERYYRFDEVSLVALNNPGVSRVEGWLDYPGTLITDKDEVGTQVSLAGILPDTTLIDPLIAEGRWLMPGDENAIVVSNFFYEILPEAKVGYWLTIDIDGKETEWQIIGIYKTTVDTGNLYVNYNYLSHIISRPNQVQSLQVLTRQHDPDTQARIADELRTQYESGGIQVTRSQTATEVFAGARSLFDVVVTFMGVMAVLIAVVGGLGLMSTMSINVMERTREIGVMRSIGASNHAIQAIVIVEGIIIGLISWAISILVSFPITGVLTVGVGMAILNIPMAPSYDASGILVWLIFTLLLSLISSSLPAARASRLTVRDTLAYE